MVFLSPEADPGHHAGKPCQEPKASHVRTEPFPVNPDRGNMEILNFGVDVQRLQDRQGRPAGQERFIWRGREINRAEAIALLTGQTSATATLDRSLPDDSHLAHLTIISRDVELRRRILRDLESASELIELRKQFRVHSYPADHWIVPRLGLDKDAQFAASGLAIVVQPPASDQGTSPARICYRYDGPAALARWLRDESPRAPMLFAVPRWVYVAIFAGGLWLMWRFRHGIHLTNISLTGGFTMQWLNGYKTYLAALLAAFVAFNHVVPVVSAEVEQAILAAAAALGLYGLRHALERLEQSRPSASP